MDETAIVSPSRSLAPCLSADPALFPLLTVGLVGFDGGDDLLGHQVDSAHGYLVGHRTLASPEDHVPRLHQVDDVFEFFDHRIGVASDDLVGRLRLLIVEDWTARSNVGRSRAPLLALALRCFPADIPRWGLPVTRGDPERRPELPVKIPAFLVGLLIGVGDTHPDSVPTLLGRGRISLRLGHPVIEIENLLNEIQWRG